MKKLLVFGVGLALLIAIAGTGYLFFKPPEAASQPIEAVPIVEKQIVVFQIIQAESEARFIIDEVLNGAPKTVVGVTNQVAGEIAVDINAPAKAKVGTILVNARTLVTDNEFRNRAVKNRILLTDDYEFVTFTPIELEGLPEKVSIGESYTFQIRGDLTVRDVTREVTFEATVTPLSETKLKGLATTTILYADYGLVIPQARSVASVDDEVQLEIEFVAAVK